MRLEDNLGSFVIDQVTKQQYDGDIYTIVYKSPDLIETVRVKLGSAGPVHYREIQKNYELANPIPPIENLAKYQYLTDRNFRQINDKLRKEYALHNYNVVKVTRQLVNGWVFKITYQLGSALSQFKVHILGKDIKVLNKTIVPGQLWAGAPITLDYA